MTAQALAEPGEGDEHQEQDDPCLTAEELARRADLMERLRAVNLESSSGGRW